MSVRVGTLGVSIFAVAALMATGAASGQSNEDRGFVASIDTAGIHEDDPTVTRDVSANIFYFLDDQDHYVHDSEGRTLTTGLTRSVTVSVDLDTQRTTATVDQDLRGARKTALLRSCLTLSRSATTMAVRYTAQRTVAAS